MRVLACSKPAMAKPPRTFSTAATGSTCCSPISACRARSTAGRSRGSGGARAALPVIYATGYTVERAAEVEGSIFLDEPYQPSLIVDTIRRLLG
jgi:hypothetical protein